MLSSLLKVALCKCFFRTRKCFFLTRQSLVLTLQKTSLFLSSSTKKRHKNTRRTPASYYYDYERERVPFSIHLLRTTKRTETMKFSCFSFFAFATLFFHQARVDVVQAAPAMMFFSPPPAGRRHHVRKEEEEEKATAFSSMPSKSSKETEDNVALLRRTSTKRANGFREAFGGRFVPVGE